MSSSSSYDHKRLQINMGNGIISLQDSPRWITKEIEERIRTYCVQQERKDLIAACLAIASYDYCLYSNLDEWDLNYQETPLEIEMGYKQKDRVKFIFKTAIKAQTEAPKELRQMIRDYRAGIIPDGYDLYDELYC